MKGVAEKISALDTESFFTEKRNKADMDRKEGEQPRECDEILD